MGESLSTQAAQYGAVGLAAIVFAIATVVVWRQSLKREDKLDAERESMVKERKDWEVQEAKIRKECEERLGNMASQYAQQLRDDRSAAAQQLREERTVQREREDDIRKEFAEMMEKVDASAQASNNALRDVLQKFYERFVGPRPRY